MGRKINIKKRETHEKTLEIERGDEGEVRAVGRIVYTDNQEGWNTRCPSIGSAYPDDAALRLKKISMEGMEGDMVRVTSCRGKRLLNSVEGRKWNIPWIIPALNSRC